MKRVFRSTACALALLGAAVTPQAHADDEQRSSSVQLGPRPFFLVEDMAPSPLKRKQLGARMTPELKAPEVPMPFMGFSQEDYAQKLIDEYKEAGVPPSDVWAQSFNIDDVLYWVKREPEFGKQAVYLDDAETVADLPSFKELNAYKKKGINIWAPPTFALLAVDAAGNIVPSQAARDAKRAGLGLITWTLERSGILADGNNGFYYQTIDSVIRREGDMMRVIDVLAKDVGVFGIFSDWPATITYYASCIGLK
jgi:glycerophosphoryl diester phosphodiesterase